MAVSLRDARLEDHADFARLFPELRVPDPVPDAEKFERELLARTIVAEDGGRTVGVLVYKLYEGVGYVHIIVADPAARRRGVGRALMTAAMERFRAGGCKEHALSCFPDNHAAIALYEQFGLRKEHVNKALVVPWALVVAEPRGAIARGIAPEDDAAVERACKLFPKQLAVARESGRTLVMLERDGAIAGASVFDPAFPGAYPFRVVSPDDAFVLLAALRPFARAEHDHLIAVVEGDPPLADHLLAAGATLRMETLRMRGPVPA